MLGCDLWSGNAPTDTPGTVSGGVHAAGDARLEKGHRSQEALRRAADENTAPNTTAGLKFSDADVSLDARRKDFNLNK